MRGGQVTLSRAYCCSRGLGVLSVVVWASREARDRDVAQSIDDLLECLKPDQWRQRVDPGSPHPCSCRSRIADASLGTQTRREVARRLQHAGRHRPYRSAQHGRVGQLNSDNYDGLWLHRRHLEHRPCWRAFSAPSPVLAAASSSCRLRPSLWCRHEVCHRCLIGLCHRDVIWRGGGPSFEGVHDYSSRHAAGNSDHAGGRRLGPGRQVWFRRRRSASCLAWCCCSRRTRRDMAMVRALPMVLRIHWRTGFVSMVFFQVSEGGRPYRVQRVPARFRSDGDGGRALRSARYWLGRFQGSGARPGHAAPVQGLDHDQQLHDRRDRGRERRRLSRARLSSILVSPCRSCWVCCPAPCWARACCLTRRHAS